MYRPRCSESTPTADEVSPLGPPAARQLEVMDGHESRLDSSRSCDRPQYEGLCHRRGRALRRASHGRVDGGRAAKWIFSTRESQHRCQGCHPSGCTMTLATTYRPGPHDPTQRGNVASRLNQSDRAMTPSWVTRFPARCPLASATVSASAPDSGDLTTAFVRKSSSPPSPWRSVPSCWRWPPPPCPSWQRATSPIRSCPSSSSTASRATPPTAATSRPTSPPRAASSWGSPSARTSARCSP